MELSKEQIEEAAKAMHQANPGWMGWETVTSQLREIYRKAVVLAAPYLQYSTPASARELDGDVVQEALRIFHSVPWGHRLASDELGDLGDRKWREGMAAVVGMLRAKHEAELQSLREQHQKDVEMALADPSHGEVNIFDLAASPAEHIPVTVIRRGLLAFLASRRALIAKDAPEDELRKFVEETYGMAESLGQDKFHELLGAARVQQEYFSRSASEGKP